MKVLIAGIGNLLRCDDGLGPSVIQRLKDEELPDNVDLLDLGISGMETLDFLAGYDKVVFIDSIRKGGRPGTVYRVDYREDNVSKDLDVTEITAFSSHEVDLNAVLEMGEKLGILPPNLVILGCEPLDASSLRIGLSKAVEEALPKLMMLIEDEVAIKVDD